MTAIWECMHVFRLERMQLYEFDLEQTFLHAAILGPSDHHDTVCAGQDLEVGHSMVI